MKVTNPKNGEEFESAFTNDAEAKAKLEQRVNASEFFNPGFPLDMISAATSKRGCSAGQKFWLHKLATEGAKKREVVATKTIDMTGLRDIFSHASTKLKRPAIVLNTSEGDVKISLAGTRSRYTGQIMVASKEYGGAYYGRVDLDGKFYPGRNASPEVDTLPEKMSADPAATAAEYGHRTGCCCFCNRSLTDERSLAVGYGPTCADNFALPWGTTVTI